MTNRCPYDWMHMWLETGRRTLEGGRAVVSRVCIRCDRTITSEEETS